MRQSKSRENSVQFDCEGWSAIVTSGFVVYQLRMGSCVTQAAACITGEYCAPEQA